MCPRPPRWPVLVAAAVLAAACGDDAGSSPATASSSGEIIVFAAASLTDVFREVSAAFETDHPGTQVILQLAGTATLREQILDGVPADVFASADPAAMATLAEASAVAAEPVVFATNGLVIAVPEGNPGAVRGLADLAESDLLVGLCAEGVPCGDLARATLDAAGVTASLDTTERDVRALLTKIAADELDAGIVYVTDVAAGGDRIEAVDIPDAVGARASYPIAVLDEAANAEGGAAFVAFVLGTRGREILAAHGFGLP